MNPASKLASAAGRLAITAASIRPVRAAARVLFRLLTPKRDIRVPLGGDSIYVRTPDRLIAVLLWKYSLDSSLEIETYRSRIRPGMTVLDVGANIGFLTLLFSKLAGGTGRVTAFEPDPENFRLLSRNVAANGRANVTCLHKAAASATGTLKLYFSEEHRGDHRIFDSGDGRKYVEVPAAAIDDVLGPGGRVDFIKMDIQGAEYLALLGMEKTIKNSRGLVMLCEFSPDLLKKCGSDPEALLQKFHEYGFSLNYLDEASHSVKSASPAELLALCPGEKYLNLLLEKNMVSGQI